MTKKGFIKYASVNTLAVATSDGDSFDKKASFEAGGMQSAFLSGIQPINIKEKLALVAEAYDISAEPSNYIFEAIRGNTANVANENKDAFHKAELLRFDHRLGKQVYRTYENKPHHINHRAENPKNARGFIVDAHYNDSSAPLDTCPNDTCRNKTASVEGRDPETGIHCRKCGTVVKDEFVELLVAIDTKKDPTFADGVMSGVLKHGSMGCSCLRTRCNVCNNVAYSRSEFCAHIRNKGGEYDDSEPNFNPIAFIITGINGKTAAKPKKVAKSFEWCEGVVYDEYSRVHDPADVKAESYEILKLSARVAQLTKDDKMRNETEILMLQSKLNQLERTVAEKIASFEKAAQRSSDVNVNITDDPEQVELESDKPLEETPDLGTPIGEITPEAMGLTPAGPGQQMSPAAAGMAPLPAPAAPPVPGRRGSVESKTLSRALAKLGGPSMHRFANSYKHLKAEITEAGNVRIYDEEGTLFAVKPASIDKNSKVAGNEGADLAKAVLTMIAEHGLGGAIKRTNALVGPRLTEVLKSKQAQVLEYYQDDMTGRERIQTDSVLEEQDTDAQERHDESQETETATGTGETSDAKEKHETKDYKGVDVLTGRDTDVEDEQHDRDPNSLSVTEMQDSDQREKRPDWNLSQSAVDDITTDHSGKTAIKTAADKCKTCKCEPCECEKKASFDAKKHAARLEQMYNKRLTDKTAALEEEKKQFIANFQDRFLRAMKIVAQRQALNLEFSPLKTSIGIVLANTRDLGDGYVFEPMDQHLAVNLTEAAFNEALVDGTDKPAWECFIDGLFERAASIMSMSDESLMQVEADLKNMQVAPVPVDVPSLTHRVSPDADGGMRVAAKAGNLQLNPNHQEVQTTPRDQKRASIRQAVGTTKVASRRASFGV